jgi:deoxyribodipyrimidine photo-lyase
MLNIYRNLNNIEYSEGIILYKMSRDQRVNDNRSLLYTMEFAKEHNANFAVIFIYQDSFLNACDDIFEFMLSGLSDTANNLKKLNIPFYVFKGEPFEVISSIMSKNNIGMLVTDFDPLKIKIGWNNSIIERIKIPFIEVDAHNIVPAFLASQKQEFGAYTLRPKLQLLLPEYLTEFPKPEKQKKAFKLTIPESAELVTLLDSGYNGRFDFIPTESAALKQLKSFISDKLNDYDVQRNHPDKDNISNLSPYLHFGKISAQRIALEVSKADLEQISRDAFLEEVITRKEVADNFCLYNKNYDSIAGFPKWAKDSLNKHYYDYKDYIYNLEILESSQTHDDLWNAANNQMLKTGKMHGYLRMYWAKKILEWTATPEIALEYAIYLNDKYSLDGRDPNGYTGIAWSIGGVHDRAWFERPIFGKIRYMSYNSQIKKFDSKSYIEKYL